jgi:hypothetical protein
MCSLGIRESLGAAAWESTRLTLRGTLLVEPLQDDYHIGKKQK